MAAVAGHRLDGSPPHLTVRQRTLSWGVLAAGLYILSALVVQSSGHPVFPLFDGFGPPSPYRWVTPPPEARPNNEPPLPGTGEVTLKGRIQNFFVTTEDGQAALSGTSDMWARPPKQQAVEVTLTPLDGQTLGPPPRGLRFDGNAYDVEASYKPSGDEALLSGDKVQMILRYPRRASVVLRWNGTAWRRLTSFVIRPSLQVYAEIQELGTFVAAGPPPRVHRRSILPWIAYGGAGLAVVGAGVAFFLQQRAKTRKRRKRPRANVKWR
jgi:hypothetical protein